MLMQGGQACSARAGWAGSADGPRLLGWDGLGWRVWEPQFSKSLSNLGLMKEKPVNAVWSMESMRFLSL